MFLDISKESTISQYAGKIECFIENSRFDCNNCKDFSEHNEQISNSLSFESKNQIVPRASTSSSSYTGLH